MKNNSCRNSMDYWLGLAFASFDPGISMGGRGEGCVANTCFVEFPG